MCPNYISLNTISAYKFYACNTQLEYFCYGLLIFFAMNFNLQKFLITGPQFVDNDLMDYVPFIGPSDLTFEEAGPQISMINYRF